jgi:hypothetical protein
MSGSDGLVDDPDARRKTIHRKSTGAEVDDRGIETAPEGNASHSRLMLGLLCRGLQTAAPQDARSPRPSSPVIVPSRVFMWRYLRGTAAREPPLDTIRRARSYHLATTLRFSMAGNPVLELYGRALISTSGVTNFLTGD